MPKAYRYLGLSKDEERRRREGLSECLKPRYVKVAGNKLKELDPPALPTEAIVERQKIDPYAHMEQKKADIEQSVADADACKMVGGVRFPKGETVVLPDGHSLLKKRPKRDIRLEKTLHTCKMDGLVASGSFEYLGDDSEATVDSDAEDGAASPLADMHWQAAIKAVADVDNPDALEAWLPQEKAKRPSVAGAIERRLVELTGEGDG